LPDLMVRVGRHRLVKIALGECENHVSHLRFCQPQCEAK
jgi:hypothetical protein